jgi:hypothetical protein
MVPLKHLAQTLAGLSITPILEVCPGISIPLDTGTLNFLKDQGKCPWKVAISFRPNAGTPSHILRGIAEGHEVILNADDQAITTAPFCHAHAIVQCVNFVRSRDREQ